MNNMLGKRLFRWFTFHVFFALFPLLALLFVHRVSGTPTDQDWNSPELVFFTFMVSAIALGDVYEMAASRGFGAFTHMLFTLLLFGAVSSIFIYGMYVQERVAYDLLVKGHLASVALAVTPHSEVPVFQATVLQFSKFQAVAFGVLGTLVQILFGRFEDRCIPFQRY